MRWDRRAIILSGLGYGDEGKGTWTDYLARTESVHTVVRFNGGAQAGHNVVTPDGRHHTFAQFGSGTFVRGVNTHLSRFMLVNPLRLLKEADELDALGVQDALARTTIDRRALVTTPFQVSANRLREIARAGGRHGSCGMGIGETMADWLAHGSEMVTAGDLADESTLRRKLRRVRDLKIEQIRDLLPTVPGTTSSERETHILFDHDGDVVETCVRAYAHLASQVQLVGDTYLSEILDLAGTVVFEGAQGALLDEWHGFHPYTTWSTTTFKNALTLLREQAYDEPILKIGLLRAYMTRHGAGPFMTEEPDLGPHFTDAYNVVNDWQQGFRVGPFDAVATRYALSLSDRPDLLAVSHLDQIASAPERRIAVAYRYRGHETAVQQTVDVEDGLIVRLRSSPTTEDLEYQQHLTRTVEQCEPVYRAVSGGTDEYLEAIEQALEAPIGLISAGPTWQDKRPRDPWRTATVR